MSFSLIHSSKLLYSSNLSSYTIFKHIYYLVSTKTVLLLLRMLPLQFYWSRSTFRLCELPLLQKRRLNLFYWLNRYLAIFILVLFICCYTWSFIIGCLRGFSETNVTFIKTSSIALLFYLLRFYSLIVPLYFGICATTHILLRTSLTQWSHSNINCLLGHFLLLINICSTLI